MIAIYIIIGFLVIRLGIVIFNVLGNLKLSSPVVRINSDFISILIPVKDEEKNIIALLNSIKAQDYQNYEVIVLDDDSWDDTYNLVSHFSLSNPQFKIVRGEKLPAGWLGKNYACYQLSKLASGDFFLFLDADVLIKPKLLNKSLCRLKEGNLSLLSLFAEQKMKTLGEWLTVPLMNYFLLSFLPLSLVKKSTEEKLAAANGQFMLFPKDSYLENGWHREVRNKVAEDYEICKKVKAKKLLVETLLGTGYLTCRMYEGLSEGINGFTKNTYSLFNYNFWGTLVFLSTISLGYVWVFYYGNYTLCLIVLGLVVGIRVLTSWLSKQNILINLVLHPFQICFMVWITSQSIYKNNLGKIVWKGRLLNPLIPKSAVFKNQALRS